MSEPTRPAVPRRGDVFLVNFDSTVGAEIQKMRPALIIQNDVGNRTSPVTIVAAITSTMRGGAYPTNVFVRAPEGGLRTDSLVLANQIRTVDRKRLVKKLGSLKPATMELVNRAVEISVGLVAI